MAHAIEVEHLVKRYRKAKTNAVDDISFSVREGEFFALLGPNGAGKTTTISILTTTLAKTSGSVSIAGHDLDRDEKGVRGDIGVIFQGASLDQNLTAEENIRLHASLYGLFAYRPFYAMMPRAYRDRVSELSGLLGIEGAMFQPIKTFSGGMKRKLEIVRSLMHRPRVLFLDEPTTGLDPLSRKTLWQYLREVRRNEQTTILLTTHYLEEAEEADHLAVIDHGTLAATGTPSELKRSLVRDTMLVDAKDRAALSRELSGLKLTFEGHGPYTVILDGSLRAQEIIKRLPLPLSRLEIERPTLEEAYVTLIENSHPGHAEARETNETP